jgi:hypothetical protein
LLAAGAGCGVVLARVFNFKLEAAPVCQVGFVEVTLECFSPN